MIILTFKDFDGNTWNLKNPSIGIINKVERLNPNSVLRVYDFKSGEILTYINDIEFKWELRNCEFNYDMKCFDAPTKEEEADILCFYLSQELIA